MSAHLQGLGLALPAREFSQEAAAEHAVRCCAADDGQARTLRAVYRRSGVEARRLVVLEDGVAVEGGPGLLLPPTAQTPLGPTTTERLAVFADHAPLLAEHACRGAMVDAGWAPEQVTHLVTVSCTGIGAPGVDAMLVRRLHLSPGTERVHVGFMGCHGAINGLRVVQALTLAYPRAHVLMACVEISSIHMQYGWDPGALIGNALFGDGAAALVASGRAGGLGFRVVATGSCLFPDSLGEMTWRWGQHGFRMHLSAKVPELIARSLRPWLASWLESQGLDFGGVAHWAVHPGGPRILAAVQEALALPEAALAASRDVLRRPGNVSSATVLFVLDKMRSAAPGERVLLLAFGPGLTAEVALLEKNLLP